MRPVLLGMWYCATFLVPGSQFYSSVGSLYGAHKSCVHIRFACADMKSNNFVSNAESFMQLSTEKSSFNLNFFHSMVLFCLQTFMFASFLLFEIRRLTGTEETVRAASKRLTQGMADFNKAISSAKTEEEKTKIVSFCDLVG